MQSIKFNVKQFMKMPGKLMDGVNSLVNKDLAETWLRTWCAQCNAVHK
jgi:hypothetical protein